MRGTISSLSLVFISYDSTKDILHAVTRGRLPETRFTTFRMKAHLLNYLLGFSHRHL